MITLMRRFRWWHRLLRHDVSNYPVDDWRGGTHCADCGDDWMWWRHWLGTHYMKGKA